MIELERRVQAFINLGEFMSQFTDGGKRNETLNELNGNFYDRILQTIQNLHLKNGWFVEKDVKNAIQAWGEVLTSENINNWVSRYDLSTKNAKTIAVIMAGNIPLVGFHDFLSVLLSGNKIQVKLSSDDNLLLPLLTEVLVTIEPGFDKSVDFVERNLKDMDAVIATGSNNSSRYFDYYFGKYPHIIRKNRNSIAVLDGSESSEELKRIGEDIFQYFGMGCRSVSKLFLPEGYDLDLFFKAIYHKNEIIDHNKYANNYDYYRAFYMMNQEKILENGFLILKQDISMNSPVAVMHYEYYKDSDQLLNRLKMDKDHIQCVVSKLTDVIEGAVPFSKSQKPELWDYADNVDTIDFLLSLDQGANS